MTAPELAIAPMTLARGRAGFMDGRGPFAGPTKVFVDSEEEGRAAVDMLATEFGHPEFPDCTKKRMCMPESPAIESDRESPCSEDLPS